MIILKYLLNFNSISFKRKAKKEKGNQVNAIKIFFHFAVKYQRFEQISKICSLVNLVDFKKKNLEPGSGDAHL